MNIQRSIDFLQNTPGVQEALLSIWESMSEGEQTSLNTSDLALQIYAKLDANQDAPESIKAGFLNALNYALNDYFEYKSSLDSGFRYASAVTEHTYRSQR